MIYFLIPVFNEGKNITNLYNELSSVSVEGDIFCVFSDDGSTDDTAGEIKKHFSKINHIILGDGKNYGPGYAFNAGFEWILKYSANDHDIIVTLEADTTSDLTILPHMIAINRLGYQLVLASVYAQGGGFDKTTFHRKLISMVANLFFRFVFDVKTLTLSSFYRVYSVGLIRKIKSEYTKVIEESGFICMLEVLLKSIQLNARIIEVPMKLSSEKRIGRSKMKIVKTSLQYFKFLLRLKFRR